MATITQPHTKRRISPEAILKKWRKKPEPELTDREKQVTAMIRKLQYQKRVSESKRKREGEWD